MRTTIALALSALFLSGTASAAVPEFFYQPDDEQTAVEVGVGYSESQFANGEDSITPRLSIAHGLTENMALRFGASYNMQDENNGMNNFNLDLIVMREMSGMTLHYGVRSVITASKRGSGNFSKAHQFNPYIGVSMGEDIKFGANFSYEGIKSTGDVWGNFDYAASLFAEMNREDSYLLGLSVDYNQISGSELDSIDANLYSRFYFDSFTLIPKVSYNLQLEDGLEDTLSAELAARFFF